MVIRKKREDNLAIRPSENKGEITSIKSLDLWSEMDRMFDNFRTSFYDLFWPWRQRSSPITAMTQIRTPSMDIANLGDRYEMHLEIPGLPKDDIKIEVTPNTVEISAQHDESKEEKDKNWLKREMSSINFYRALELLEELKTDNVDAELKEGILTLTLLKVKPKPKQIAKKVKIK